MRPDVVECLRCPVCGSLFASSPARLRCAEGHAFDVARQGYVSFLVGRATRLVGDDAAMVAARASFLAGGHLDPLADAIASFAAAAGPGLVVEVGAGTGFYLARALEALPAHAGLALDLSKHAGRRAARAHARLAAAVVDARGRLPLADGCAGVVIDVFAPRNGQEIRRILRDDGRVLVATPRRDHLAEGRTSLGLLRVDPDKDRRVNAALEPHLRCDTVRELAWTMTLSRGDVLALASMGPSARHLDAAELDARVRALPEPFAVTASVQVALWRPRG